MSTSVKAAARMSAQESWGHEMESVFLYRVVAEAEGSAERRDLFT